MKNMTTLSQLLRPFAKGIHAKAVALRALDLSRTQRARLLESISDDIKKCSNFTSPFVSKAALARAEKLKVSLHSKTWHDQPRFDKERKVFHFEHYAPVSSIRDACLKARSAEAVLRLLKGRLKVVWILKSEDRTLTALGFRSRRANPVVAYKAANIRLAAQQRVPADATALRAVVPSAATRPRRG